jgi:hypothetical protein
MNDTFSDSFRIWSRIILDDIFYYPLRLHLTPLQNIVKCEFGLNSHGIDSNSNVEAKLRESFPSNKRAAYVTII